MVGLHYYSFSFYSRVYRSQFFRTLGGSMNVFYIIGVIVVIVIVLKLLGLY